GSPTNGSAIAMQGSSMVVINRVRMQRNSGGRVFFNHEPATFGSATLKNCLISDNDITNEVLRAEGDTGVDIENCTFANNAVQSPFVIHEEQNFKLADSIFFENKPTIQRVNSGFFNISFVISNDVST